MPVCPIHGKEMTRGKFGFFCSTFIGVGAPMTNAKGFCSQQTKDQAPAPRPQPIAQPVATQGPRSRFGDCLMFSGLIYRGGGPEMRDEALDYAKQILAEWPE